MLTNWAWPAHLIISISYWLFALIIEAEILRLETMFNYELSFVCKLYYSQLDDTFSKQSNALFSLGLYDLFLVMDFGNTKNITSSSRWSNCCCLRSINYKRLYHIYQNKTNWSKYFATHLQQANEKHNIRHLNTSYFFINTLYIENYLTMATSFW